MSAEALQSLPFLVLFVMFVFLVLFEVLVVVANWLHGHTPLRDEDEELGVWR